MKSKRLAALLTTLILLAQAPAALADATGDLLQAISEENPKLAITAIEQGADVNVKLVDGNTPMHWAAYTGNKALIELLLAKGADIEIRYGEGGSTPLMLAASNGKLDMVEFLLSKGAKVDATDSYGNTALFGPVRANHLAVAKALVAHGANIHARNQRGETLVYEVLGIDDRQAMLGWLLEQGVAVDEPIDETGRTALHLAALHGQPEVVKLLLAKGAKVDSRSTAGYTPLLELADSLRHPTEGQLPALALLLDHGADIEAKNKDGLNALQLAVNFAWQPESVALLLSRGANPDVRDPQGRTPLMRAIIGNAVPGILNLLLDKGADLKAHDADGATPLMLLASVTCSEEGQDKIYADLAARMLDRGAELEARDAGTQTALMYAAGMLTQSGRTNGPCSMGAAMIERLIARGAKVDAVTEEGFTPLMYAVSQNPAKVEALLKHGAKVNARAANGKTALYYALVESPDEYLGIVRALLLKGADPALKDEDGITPLALAEGWEARDARLLALLRNPKLNLAARPLDARVLEAAAGEDVEALKQALAQGKNPNAQDEAGTTALMMAARAGKDEMVKLLLAKGADPRRVDAFKQNALHHTYAEYMDREQRMGIVRQLLARGVDPKVRDAKGDTPLMLAVAKDSESVFPEDNPKILPYFKSLLVKGMDLNARIQADPSTGNTMLFEAARSQNLPLLKLLLEQGARPDATTADGLTPLMAAAAYDPAAVDLLLKRGANPKATGGGGWTTLMNAAAAGADQNVRLLLAKGAPLEATYAGDGSNYAGGETALLIAAANGKPSTVKLLLEKGARRDATDKQGRTVLMMASRRLGYDILGKSEAAKGAEISGRLDDGQIGGKLALVAMLLEQGLDPARKDKLGRTALDYAQEYAADMPGSPPENYQALVTMIRSAQK